MTFIIHREPCIALTVWHIEKVFSYNWCHFLWITGITNLLTINDVFFFNFLFSFILIYLVLTSLVTHCIGYIIKGSFKGSGNTYLLVGQDFAL